MTRPLLSQGNLLTVVELDWDLAAALRTGFKDNNRLQVIEGDILKIDWSQILHPEKRNIVVANLPYNISTPVFFKFVSYRRQLDSIVIMVQKELAERLLHSGAGKKLKDYGILSVVAGNTFIVSRVCDVPAACFTPRPKVDSTVVRLTPKELDIKEEELFFMFVRQAFNNRRKLFVSFLKREYPSLFQSLSMQDQSYLSGIRPENLSPGQFLKLFLGRPLKD